MRMSIAGTGLEPTDSRRVSPALFLLVVALLLATGTTLAQPRGGPPEPPLQPDAAYDLSWHVVAGGGWQVQAGRYALGGTAGQPAAGRVPDGRYGLCAGFWCLARAGVGYGVYLPLVYRAREP